MYKKSLGQHYLNSSYIAKKIVSYLNIEPTDTIVEIGAGRGALTQHIVNYNFKKLIIIELDTDNCKYLKEKFTDAELICKDAQDISYNTLITKTAKLISNLPYNVGTRIFKKVVDSGVFSLMVLMFQKELAERIVAKTNSKAYSKLSLLAQKSYTSKLLVTVKPGNFIPPPEVQSSVISLKAKKLCPLILDIKLFNEITSAVFNNRRKMLRVSLKTIFPPRILDLTFKESKIQASKRPQELSFDDFITMSNSIYRLTKNIKG